MTVQSFDQHLRSQAAPPPRTMREEEMLEIQQREVSQRSHCAKDRIGTRFSSR